MPTVSLGYVLTAASQVLNSGMVVSCPTWEREIVDFKLSLYFSFIISIHRELVVTTAGSILFLFVFCYRTLTSHFISTDVCSVMVIVSLRE